MGDTETDRETLPSLLDPAVQDDPYDLYDELRRRCPVYRVPENDTYLLSCYGDVRAALTDPETFSSRPSAGAGGRHNPAAEAYHRVLSEKGWARASTLQRTDPPVHTRYRKLLNRVFTQRRVNELAPHIDDVTHSLVDDFEADGACEFVSQFALPLPGIIIAEQLGLDRSEIATFKRWADAMLALAQRVLTVDEAIAEAEIELEAQHFLADVFEQRRAAPTDDLISALVHSHGDDEEPLTIHELQDLMHQLITGGFETTTSALAAGMWLLILHPGEQARLRADRSLMKGFIEETLRYESPVQGLWRVATCPVDMAGDMIPAGAAVMPRYGAANRDPAQFVDPDRFDITRDDVGSHLAFGLGNHFCIGAALARQEMDSAFSALLDRLDRFALDNPPEPLHEPSFFLRPMKALPIRFDPRRRSGQLDPVDAT